MLRLQTHLVSALRAASSLPASSLLRARLLSAASTSVARFVPYDYLVAKCGLTPEQAREASKNLTSLESPSNPDAVRIFLAGLGLPTSAAATAIARHPQILCSKVDETLARRAAELRKIGLSPGEISRLVTICPELILCRIRVSRLAFYFSLMGSCDKVRVLLEDNADLLEQSLGDVVKPNLAFLQKAVQCHADNLPRMVYLAPRLLTAPLERLKAILAPRLLTAPLERLKAILARGEECSGSLFLKFYYAVMADQSLLQKKLVSKVELLKSFGFSNIWLATWLPHNLSFYLQRSEKLLQRTAHFLTREAVDFLPNEGIDALSPNLLVYSTEKRFVPRFNIVKILIAEGLLDETIARQGFGGIMCMDMLDFDNIFVRPYEDHIPAIAHAYALVRARDHPCSKGSGLATRLPLQEHSPLFWGLTKIPVK